MRNAGHLRVGGIVAGYGDAAVRAPRGGAPVLAGIDFEVPAGHCLAVVGRSGCGKSTLLNVLAGVLPPAHGEVVLDGEVVVAAPADGRAAAGGVAHAAYMFQQDLLLPWKTALGNATVGARLAARGARRRGSGTVRPAIEAPGPQPDGLDERARRLLREFGLGDALEALPAELSGGMRQRVALARTLLMDRELVLLDEPFGSLDAVTRAEMRRWMLGVMDAHPATWVLVTHDVDEAVLLGDHVAVLHGRPARLTAWTDSALSREERLAAADGALTAVAATSTGWHAASPADRLAGAAAAIGRALAAGEAA